MRTLALLALVGALGTAQAQPAGAPARLVPQIAATGVGELRLPPARATVRLVIEVTGANAADVGEDVARRVTRVRRALEKAGIAPEAIENAGYGLRNEPHRAEHKDKPFFVGRHGLTVRIGEVSKAGAVIDAALGAGASEVADVSFHPADEAQAKNQALGAAVARARGHAEAIAAAAGGRLGELIEIVYGEGDVRPIAIARADTDVSRAEIVVTERVKARWRFVEKTKK
ncbi:MAG TPA: SIMPL domain-containing protein [Burkholderiales bacterium]|nr:SIMPL domain-containing protein [Burkholderiales bacterium]